MILSAHILSMIYAQRQRAISIIAIWHENSGSSETGEASGETGTSANTDNSVATTNSSSIVTNSTENSGNTSSNTSTSGDVDNSTMTQYTDSSRHETTDSRNQSTVNNYDYSTQSNSIDNAWNNEENESIRVVDQKKTENNITTEQAIGKESLSEESGQGSTVPNSLNNIKIDMKNSDVVFEVKDGVYSITVNQAEQHTEQVQSATHLPPCTD